MSVLGFVGEEGAGKSSLINALLGIDVVVEARFTRGSAVPVRVERSDDNRWYYAVKTRDGTSECSVSSQADFDAIVSSDSPEHHLEHVDHGVVRIPSDIVDLSGVLVDMPGWGHSRAIQPEIGSPGGSGVDSLVLVAFDRALGPARDILLDLRGRSRLSLAALVINMRISKLIDEDGVCRADDEVAYAIGELRKLGWSTFERGEWHLPRDCVFACHIPSLKQYRS